MNTILAQVPEAASALLVYGPMGIMLAWFMFRQEARQKKQEISMDRCARGMALLVISLDSSNDATKDQARELVREIDRDHPRDEFQ